MGTEALKVNSEFENRTGQAETSDWKWPNYCARAFGVDPRALAAFRFGIATILFCDYGVRSLNVLAHYSDQGVLPRVAALSHFSDPAEFSLYFMNGSTAFQFLLIAASAILSLCLAVGYRTSWSTFLSWVMLVSIQNRNQLILTSGDNLLRVMLFWSMFLPLGLCYSVDAAAKIPRHKTPGKIVSFASGGLLLQSAMIYFFVALHKTGVDWVSDGSAVYYALRLEQMRSYLGFLFLKLPFQILKFISFSTLYFQFAAPVILFSPFFTTFFRLVIPLGLMFLQVGFGSCLNLGLFPWISIVAVIPFLPTPFWDRATDWVERKKRSNVGMNLFGNHYFLKLTGLGSRKLFPSVLAFNSKGQTSRSWLSRATQIFCLILILDVLKINVGSLWPQFKFTTGLEKIEKILRLDQTWEMFSPNPPHSTGWYVFPGKLEDGTEVDAYTHSFTIDWAKPADIASLYPNNRWQKFMLNLGLKKRENQRLYYGRYLCRKWNDEAPVGRRLATFEIVNMESANLMNDASGPTIKKVLWSHTCLQSPGQL